MRVSHRSGRRGKKGMLDEATHSWACWQTQREAKVRNSKTIRKELAQAAPEIRGGCDPSASARGQASARTFGRVSVRGRRRVPKPAQVGNRQHWDLTSS